MNWKELKAERPAEHGYYLVWYPGYERGDHHRPETVSLAWWDTMSFADGCFDMDGTQPLLWCEIPPVTEQEWPDLPRHVVYEADEMNKRLASG